MNYATYELEHFIFDIGGLIGLFLGSSILSLLELFVNVCKFIKKQAENVNNLCKQKIELDNNLDMIRAPDVVIEIPNDDKVQLSEIQVEDLEEYEVL